MVLYAGTFAPLSAEEAEDLAHDALVHAWFRIDRHDPSKPLSPWLYRVARNFIIDYLRRRPDTVPLDPGSGRGGATGGGYGPVTGGIGGQTGGRTGTGGDTADPAFPGEDPAERAVTADLASRAAAAIARLDGKDRRIALLIMREGLTARQAGDALGIPAGTVRWRLSRIRARIRAEVDGNGKGEP